MSQDRTIRFTVSLPEELLQELDARIISRGYSSRSEFVRDLIREKLVDDLWSQKEEDVVGVITLIYDHHQHELAKRMIEIQHESQARIHCTTHIHLDGHNCLETIILEGKTDQIHRSTLEIGGLRGVKFSHLTRTSTLPH